MTDISNTGLPAPSFADEPNVKPFRGKQGIRDTLRANHDDMMRRIDAIEKRLEAIERSL